MTDFVQKQREIASVALKASENHGFALAGSGAIREHGLINRPTQDVDIFSTMEASATFKPTVDNVIAALREHGYQVDVDRQSDYFARLVVRDPDDGYRTEIDMGIDYRSLPTTRLSVGPVLSLRDAVANKATALFSRNETRDFLDFDSIRRKSPFSDKELIELISETDLGFDLHYFVQILDSVSSIQPSEVKPYGYSAADLKGVQTRLLAFANQVRHGLASDRHQQNSTKGKSELMAELNKKTENQLEHTHEKKLRGHQHRI